MVYTRKEDLMILYSLIDISVYDFEYVSEHIGLCFAEKTALSV